MSSSLESFKKFIEGSMDTVKYAGYVDEIVNDVRACNSTVLTRLLYGEQIKAKSLKCLAEVEGFDKDDIVLSARHQTIKEEGGREGEGEEGNAVIILDGTYYSYSWHYASFEGADYSFTPNTFLEVKPIIKQVIVYEAV